MRFGRALHKHRIPEWTSYYLDYYELKKHIKLAIRNTSQQSNDTNLTGAEQVTSANLATESSDCFSAFSSILDAEIAKVEAFYSRQHASFQKQHGALLSHVANSADASTTSGHSLCLEEQVGALVACIQYSLGLRKLRWYGKVNNDALKYLLRKIERVPAFARLQKKDFFELECFSQQKVLQDLEKADVAILSLTTVHPGIDVPISARLVELSETIRLDNVERLEELLRSVDWHDNFTYSVLQGALITQSPNCTKTILRYMDTKLQDEHSGTSRNVLHLVVILAVQRATLCQTESIKERYSRLALKYDSCVSDPLQMLRFVLEALDENSLNAIVQRDYRGRTPLHYAAEAGLTDYCDTH